MASAYFEATDISEVSLQQLVCNSYATENLPYSRLLMIDGNECVAFLLNPTNFLDSGPMPRDIVFAIDFSGSTIAQRAVLL